MRLQQIIESPVGAAGHMALDAIGLIPGLGEPADLANALWYIKNKDYLSAAFSIISLVPEIGDAIGKGAKYLGKGSKLGQSALIKIGPQISKAWPKVLSMVEKSDQLKPYARHLDAALKAWLNKNST